MKDEKSTTLPSATVLINSIAQKKIAAGIKVFNLSAGEPNLPMAPALIQAADAAMAAGKVHYPPVDGVSECRVAAGNWMNEWYGANYSENECLIVNGGKFGIYLFMQLMLSPGEEVIIPAPYWVSYPPITKLFKGVPVILPTTEANGWKITPQQLTDACTKQSRVLILNNAANPTGTLYTKAELRALLTVAKQHDLYILSDEVYSGLVYDDHTYVSCASFPEFRDKLIVIQSASKNFAMTGWRIGFVFAEPSLIKKMSSLVSQSTSGVTTISQWVALAAFQDAGQINGAIRQLMQKRRDVIIDAFKQTLGIQLTPPASGLYLFVALSTLGVEGMTDAEFCTQALEEANVAMVPGSAFGMSGYVRLSFGAKEDELIAGVKALKMFLTL